MSNNAGCTDELQPGTCKSQVSIDQNPDKTEMTSNCVVKTELMFNTFMLQI